MIPAKRTFTSTERHNTLGADTVAELWCIDTKKAQDTLKVTTQNRIRSVILPICWQYRADRMYNLKHLHNNFATDTLWEEIKSLHQNVCAHVYSHKGGFAVTYPL